MGDPYIWLGILVLLLIIEAYTVQLVTIWFAIGAAAAAIAAIFGIGSMGQIGVFVAVATISLIGFRPFVRKKLSVPISKTNADRILEQKAIVTQKIDPEHETGQVRLLNQTWSAKSENGECIEKGDTVIVINIVGVKAIVRKTGKQEEES